MNAVQDLQSSVKCGNSLTAETQSQGNYRGHYRELLTSHQKHHEDQHRNRSHETSDEQQQHARSMLIKNSSFLEENAADVMHPVLPATARPEQIYHRRLAKTPCTEMVEEFPAVANVDSSLGVLDALADQSAAVEMEVQANAIATDAVGHPRHAVQMRREVLDVFKRFDLDADGFISLHELASVFRGLGPALWTDEEINSLMMHVDSNGDGMIALAEFVDWVYNDAECVMAIFSGKMELSAIALECGGNEHKSSPASRNRHHPEHHGSHHKHHEHHHRKGHHNNHDKKHHDHSRRKRHDHGHLGHHEANESNGCPVATEGGGDDKEGGAKKEIDKGDDMDAAHHMQVVMDSADDLSIAAPTQGKHHGHHHEHHKNHHKHHEHHHRKGHHMNDDEHHHDHIRRKRHDQGHHVHHEANESNGGAIATDGGGDDKEAGDDEEADQSCDMAGAHLLQGVMDNANDLTIVVSPTHGNHHRHHHEHHKSHHKHHEHHHRKVHHMNDDEQHHDNSKRKHHGQGHLVYREANESNGGPVATKGGASSPRAKKNHGEKHHAHSRRRKRCSSDPTFSMDMHAWRQGHHVHHEVNESNGPVATTGGVSSLHAKKTDDEKHHAHSRRKKRCSSDPTFSMDVHAWRRRYVLRLARSGVETQRDAIACDALGHPRTDRQTRREVLSIFRRFDLDADGFISANELASVFRGLGPATWTEEEISTLMIHVDRNGDGMIELDEFVDWVYTGDWDCLMALVGDKIEFERGIRKGDEEKMGRSSTAPAKQSEELSMGKTLSTHERTGGFKDYRVQLSQSQANPMIPKPRAFEKSHQCQQYRALPKAELAGSLQP